MLQWYLSSFIQIDSGHTVLCKGPSINDVGNWEEERGQKLVKIANMREGGFKNPEKLPPLFMDGP